MARKPTPMIDPSVPADEARIDALYAAEQAATAPASQDDRDLVNQLLGQTQALSATSSMLQTFGVSKLAFVKENKLYRALAGRFGPNGLELKGTWQEFCGLLGMSDEKANQDIANLRAFGEEALESMSRMGIGYRELRQFRKLPADQKTALIEAAQTGDKEQLEDLAEELLAKHEREKELLKKQHDEAVRDLEAARSLNAEKTQQLDAVKAELHRRKFDREPWKKDARDAVQEIATAQATAVEALTRLAAMREALMHNQELSEEAHDYAVRCLVAEAQYTAQQAAQVWMDTQAVFGSYLDMPLPAMEVLEQLAEEQGA